MSSQIIWQPIETALKEYGRRILLAGPVEGRYSPGDWHCARGYWHPFGGNGKGCWVIDGPERLLRFWPEPTHWSDVEAPPIPGLGTNPKPPIDDCGKCAARLDGMDATHCYHAAFEKSHPGNGREIGSYPRTPAWCPGMVDED